MYTLPKENVDSSKLGIPTKKKKALQRVKDKLQIEQILAARVTAYLLSGICKELLQISNSWTFKKKYGQTAVY